MAKLNIKNLAEALFETAEGKSPTDQKKVIHEAIMILDKNGCLGKSDELVEQLQKIDDDANNVARAEVISKNALSKKERDEITEFLKKKHKAEHVILEEKIDEGVLGGLKVKVGDTLYDGTLKTKLNQLQMHLTN